LATVAVQDMQQRRGIIGSSKILLERAATLEPCPFHRWVETGFERLEISGTDHVGTHFPGNQFGQNERVVLLPRRMRNGRDKGGGLRPGGFSPKVIWGVVGR